MLKLLVCAYRYRLRNQPPSGGCVLKQQQFMLSSHSLVPAAFGRLCVETPKLQILFAFGDPAAFGRLCVETVGSNRISGLIVPAAFGRLCVET